MIELLEVAKLSRSDDTNQPKLENASAKVTTHTNQLVDTLRKLPNAQNVTLEDKEDLDKVAEEELQKCASIIAEAAKSLASAKPERKTAIVDAAQAIANATGILVQHA